MKPKIVTIGAYGFDQESFFQALLDAKVDTFCDIRMRRGMRGSKYAFVNSSSLQKRLGELDIQYMYLKDLAPDHEIRAMQKHEDERLGITKRTRKVLGQTFIQAYEKECLSTFNTVEFIEQLEQNAQVIGLFCVEREPEACHRSLAAKRIAQDLELQVEHITP
ncbi:MAG: DUF488 family protein [Ktedonobacteraceae bacterium]